MTKGEVPVPTLQLTTFPAQIIYGDRTYRLAAPAPLPNTGPSEASLWTSDPTRAHLSSTLGTQSLNTCVLCFG
jgi:hypothetical protein